MGSASKPATFTTFSRLHVGISLAPCTATTLNGRHDSRRHRHHPCNGKPHCAPKQCTPKNHFSQRSAATLSAPGSRPIPLFPSIMEFLLYMYIFNGQCRSSLMLESAEPERTVRLAPDDLLSQFLLSSEPRISMIIYAMLDSAEEGCGWTVLLGPHG
jgi:hypothetical protein